ncbi:MAG TPA: TorF family putative porin [Caulobacteraceae bacterium]|jgi:uncharacterized protein (TIGR02001 family)
MRYVAFAIAVAAVAASAAAAEPAAAPKPVGPCAGVYVSAAGTSDYRFDGFSESDRQPTWQVTAYCYRNDGYFAGTTLTGINFLDSPRTPVEADWYVGRQLALGGGWKLTGELFYASFPGKRAPGPSYDIVEPQLEVSRQRGRLNLDGQVAWEDSVSGGGQEWRFKGAATYALTPWLAASGHFARFVLATGGDHDYDAWDVGLTATHRRLSLDARYGGTDRPPAQCFFTRWCEPGFYATVAYRVWP